MEFTRQPAPDVIEAVERLLAEAKAGRLVGIAWAAMYLGGNFEVDALGLALSDPIHTIGLLRLLEAKALELIER